MYYVLANAQPCCSRISIRLNMSEGKKISHGIHALARSMNRLFFLKKKKNAQGAITSSNNYNSYLVEGKLAPRLASARGPNK